MPCGWLMLEMSTEITVEWFSGDLLLFCNRFGAEEASWMGTDAGSSCTRARRNTAAKHPTSSCLNGKKVISKWPKEEIHLKKKKK